MVFFVVYAVVTWYLAFMWRRRWRAGLVVALALVGLVSVSLFHLWLRDVSRGRIFLESMQVILYPYTVLVAGIGAYIAVLPRRPESACAACGYDLQGLAGEPGALCPECGAFQLLHDEAPGSCRACAGVLRRVRKNRFRCRACGRQHMVLPKPVTNYPLPRWRLAADEPMEHAQRQDAQREPGEQQDAQGGEHAGVEVADERDGPGRGALRDEVVAPRQPQHR